MRKTYLLTFLFSILLLSGCSNDENLCSPPVLDSYSINIYLTDKAGNDRIKELPLEVIKSENEEMEAYKRYSIKEGDFHFYFDGKEILPQQGIESPSIRIERSVLELPESNDPPFIYLTFAGRFIDIDEFRAGPQPTHTFEYRFTLPSMFGEEEQVIAIQCEARNFHSTDPKKVFINGTESESNGTNSFTLVVDKE